MANGKWPMEKGLSAGMLLLPWRIEALPPSLLPCAPNAREGDWFFGHGLPEAAALRPYPGLTSGAAYGALGDLRKAGLRGRVGVLN